MSAARHAEVDARVGTTQESTTDGAKSIGRRLVVAHRLVQRLEHLCRSAREDRRSAQRVPGQARDRRGLRAFARDVTDEEAPVVAADLEHVVEVTAHLVAFAGGDVARGNLDTGNARK